MKSPIDLIGGFYTVDGLNWACQDTVNYLPMAAEAGGTKTPTMLKSPPGLKPFANIGDGPDYVIRGMHDVEGQLFVVSGNRLYQLMTTTGVAIPIGEIPGVGRVSMSHNQIAGGNQLLVVNGQSGYIYNTRTQDFSRITDPGYPGAFAADFIDGYFVQVEPFGRYVFHSNLADGLDYNTLDRFEAESQPDNIVALLVVNDEVRVFGSRTQQIFTNTDAAQGTFQSKGITIDRGCAGRFTPARLDNGVFFLGDDGVVYRDNGYNPIRISTHAIEEAIAGNDWSQAFAFTWQAHGHSVYYLTFPDGQTWGYDIAYGLWHRRATYHPSFEVSRRWRLNALAYSRSKWYGGDSTSGRIYTLDWDYMMEGDQPLVSERTSQVTYNAGNRFQIQELDLQVRTGEKATTPQDFILQPQGPSISGDAPSAIEGEAYLYSYTATEGDSPIVKVYVSEGALPSGLSMSQAGTISGTPNSYGTARFRVRVVDENGLWDEISDSIEVAPVWIAVGDGIPANRYAFGLSNGTDWDHPARVADSGGSKVYRLAVTTGQEILLVTAFGAAGSYSSDRGQSFVNVTGLSGETALAIAYDGAAFVVARNSRKIDVSTSGNAFTTVTVGNTNPDDGTGNFFSAAATKELIVCCSSRSTVSSDHGATFSPLGMNYVFPSASTPSSGPIAKSLATDGIRFVAVGEGNNISWSANGLSWTELDSPFPGSADLTAVSYSEGVWVVCNQDGRIAVGNVFGEMKISDFEFGSAITAINSFGGTTVIAGGGGKIAYSVNNGAWVFAETGFGPGVTFFSLSSPNEAS